MHLFQTAFQRNKLHLIIINSIKKRSIFFILRLSCSHLKRGRRGGESWFYTPVNLSSRPLWSRDTETGGSSQLFVLWCIVVGSVCFLPTEPACNMVCLLPALSLDTVHTRRGWQDYRFFPMRPMRFVTNAEISVDLLRSVLLVLLFGFR